MESDLTKRRPSIIPGCLPGLPMGWTPSIGPLEEGGSDDDDEDIWTQAAAAAKQRGNAMFQRAEHQHAVQLYTVSGHMDFQPALQRLQVLSMQCHVFTQLCTT